MTRKDKIRHREISYLAIITVFVFCGIFALHSCTKENTKPEANITSPQDNASFTIGDEIQIKTFHQDKEQNIRNCYLSIDELNIFLSNAGENTYKLNTANFNPGQYHIRLYVEDAEGLTAEDSKLITINRVPIVSVASFSVDRIIGAAPLTVIFADSSTNNPTMWLWDFGDGVTSEEQNPHHIYSTEGIYSVTLKAGIDQYGALFTKNDLITVYAPIAPVAGFSATPLTGNAPLEVSFRDTSLNHPTQWFWDFGDGTTSTEQYPTKIYDQPGEYYVSLDVSNEIGNDRITYNKLINVMPSASSLNAGIYIPFVSGENGTSISFYDASENNPQFWEWNFGDGNTSRDQNPTHIYNEVGNYTVSLTVHNNLESSTIAINNAVTIYGPCPEAPEVTDIDGNHYKTVQIGDQCWMAENLKVTRYPDSTAIPYIESISDWENLDNTFEDDAFCYYQNDAAFGYGGIYTYAAVIAKNWVHQNQALQGICPDGWHIPTDDEWILLEGVTDTELYPGHWDFHRSDMWRGYDVGKQLKSSQGWFTKANGENRSGFSALPGGMRSENGDFVTHEYDCYFWTSNSTKYESGAMRKLSYNYDGSWRSSLKRSCGLYVRCVKNDE